MNSIQMEILLRAIVNIINSTFQFQAALAKMVIDCYPKISESEKANFLSLLEGLQAEHTLLKKHADEILPS